VRSFRDRNPYAVGLASVLVIGALVGVAFMIGVLHLFEHAYDMKGIFNAASGIRSGDDVRVAGVKVGRVTGIKADRRHGNVIVTWKVNHGVQLGPDTKAEIALETLLGAKYLRLTGKVHPPYLEDLPAEQRTIPMTRTKTPFDLFELTSVATRSIEETKTDELNQLVNQLADITAGKQQTVRDLVTGLDKVSSAVNQRDAELRELLDRADKLSATLADKDQTLVQLIDTSQAVLQLVSQRRDDLARALGEGSDVVNQLSSIISDHKVQLDRILTTLHPTVAVVDKNLEAVETALPWLGPGFLQQSLGGTHGPWLDIFVRSLGPDVVHVLHDVYAQVLPKP
jgi:phospholipid/cholesterol/gamma-HCH transport system substrate-binding protein